MGWHMNDHSNADLARGWFNPRSPRYNRRAPTKRQRTVYRRRSRACVHSLSYQIGGGQCGSCGKWTRRQYYDAASV